MDTRNGVRIALVAAATPLIGATSVLLVLGGAGASGSPAAYICGGGGTGQTIAGVRLDAEQMGNARTIVSVVAARRLPVFAADIAVATAYTESTLHNTSTHTDHDSEGLFQQRTSIYGKQVADNPVNATNAFLDRLVRVTAWQTNVTGADAQAVQQSAHPERYQPNAALAEQLVGQLWPTASAAADGTPPTRGPTTATRPPTTSQSESALCAGGGGAQVAGTIVGPTGNNIAGITRVPAGFVISGTAKGRAAVRFALDQLGKPYLFGAAGPDSFDCSGLTMAAWSAAGVALPHLAADQAHVGTPEPSDLSEAVGGDLVLIPGSDGTAAHPGHVGMVAGYVDRADGRHLYLIQAPETGVPIELTEATEWSGQITDVRHIASPTSP